MIIVANTVSKPYLDAIANLPYKVCNATRYLDGLIADLELDPRLQQPLHQALASRGVSCKLKVDYVLDNPSDIVVGLSIQESLLLRSITDATILYPPLPIPGFDGFCFVSVDDLLFKISSLLG